MRSTWLTVSIFATLLSCTQTELKVPALPMEVVQDSLNYSLSITSKDSLYDKILGSLIGSAIGDAMGAPTEMWSRQDRERSYGFIESLDPSFIDPSPEGLWDFHLPTGATTDDTRWKSLAGNYVSQQIGSFYRPEGPDPYQFAEQILTSYRQEVARLKDSPGENPRDIEYHVRRLTWLQEWASVAEPFVKKDMEAYTTALHTFYGGELLCAGMLYAPALGLPYPGDPLKAYHAAHRLGIFDQGYARDITGLTAAMVAAAMAPGAKPSSVMEIFRTVDPYDYFRSRLFGRLAFKTFQTAEYIVDTAKSFPECTEKPATGQDSMAKCQMIKAFKLLDQQNQHAPAHAQEILLVTLTAMLYSDFDFTASLEFITNYGRDNDTSGAVAGAVLGAYHGYAHLPNKLKESVMETNRNNLGIDLEKLAAEITEGMISFINNQS